MNIEQKETPSIADSAKSIINSIGKLSETSVKSVKALKQMQRELDIRDRIIHQQSSEIKRLKERVKHYELRSD